MNKVNLQRMADYIRTIPQDSFDIRFYRSGRKTQPECKSVGCVVGHCTILDAENIENNFTGIGGIEFYEWSLQFTGLRAHKGLWAFCFSSGWVDLDNTTEGAAKRIEMVIKGTIHHKSAEYLMYRPAKYFELLKNS